MRLIDADEIEQYLEPYVDPYEIPGVLYAISYVPEIDVVRCENCRYYHSDENGMCVAIEMYMDENDFCSIGRRKEKNG